VWHLKRKRLPLKASDKLSFVPYFTRGFQENPMIMFDDKLSNIISQPEG
jgi:hypothetical protein